MISCFNTLDSCSKGINLSFSYSSILYECTSSLKVRCIAVMVEVSFCFLIKLLANRKSDFPFSLFPKEIKMLYLSSLWISSRTLSSFVLKIKFMIFNVGPVIKVVTNAMMTIIVNTSGVSTLRSKPIFKTMSSIKPRVFIKAPIVKLSRQL